MKSSKKCGNPGRVKKNKKQTPFKKPKATGQETRFQTIARLSTIHRKRQVLNAQTD